MKLKVGPFDITDRGRAFVIAEAGVNHNGDLSLAKQLVAAAKAAGADCIKFQTFRADRLAVGSAPKAPYQLQTTDRDESQRQMLSKLELSEADYRQIARLCADQQLVFLSTPYDRRDADLLESLGVEAYKVASGQAVEPLFLQHVAQKGKPVFLSTGMCTLAEVERAVGAIRLAGNDQVVALQCTTSYPSKLQDANILAMATMRQKLDVLVGYSDHTKDSTSAAAAVALGACVVEKHFTLDRSLPGPDQAASCQPDEFAAWVRAIRQTELALGSATKAPTQAERQNMAAVRRGVVATARIPAGGVLTPENVDVKRPASHLGGEDLPRIMGCCAKVDIEPDTPLTPEMIQ